jgi:hypothetical protein
MPKATSKRLSFQPKILEKLLRKRKHLGSVFGVFSLIPGLNVMTRIIKKYLIQKDLPFEM